MSFELYKQTICFKLYKQSRLSTENMPRDAKRAILIGERVSTKLFFLFFELNGNFT